MSALHWKSALRNVWGHQKRVSMLWRCLSCATITCTFAVTFAACWTSGAVAYFSKLFTIEEAKSRKVEAVKFVGSLQTGNETEVIAAYKVIS